MLGERTLSSCPGGSCPRTSVACFYAIDITAMSGYLGHITSLNPSVTTLMSYPTNSCMAV